MRALPCLLACLLTAYSTVAASYDFGPLREESPEKSISLKLPCNGRTLDAHLDAAKFFYPDNPEKPVEDLVVTQEFYLVWWLNGVPSIIDKKEGYAEDIKASDINGDGVPELLVRYGAGGHTNVLVIFAIKDCEISQLPGAEFGSDDEDTIVESEQVNGYPVITEINRDWENPKGLKAPPIRTRYKWNGKSYVLMSKKRPTNSD